MEFQDVVGIQMELIIPQQLSNAWKDISRALRDSNFSIVSRDLSTFSFLIRHTGLSETSSRSLLVRLGLRKNKSSKVITQYRVQLTAGHNDDATIAVVLNMQDQVTAVNNEILTVLFESLKN